MAGYPSTPIQYRAAERIARRRPGRPPTPAELQRIEAAQRKRARKAAAQAKGMGVAEA